MNKCNSIEAMDKRNLPEQTKFQLDEINKIENYFIEEINQRKLCSKKLGKYLAAFDYIDKVLIFFKCNKWRSIFLLIYKYCCAPVGIASACFTLTFSLSTGITKKLLNTTRKTNEKA